MNQDSPKIVELTKKQDILDILFLKKAGYWPDSLAITSYSGSLPTIKLKSTVSQLFPFVLKANDVSGWSGDSLNGPFPSGYNLISADNLHMDIDGGDMQYIAHGLVNGIIQTMASGSISQLTAYAFNFQTADSATAMFNAQKSNYGPDYLQIGSYNQSIAIGVPVLGGITAFAHKNTMYFELAFNGFDDQAQAIATAKLFIDKYFSKITN
jgi:hypothetical protein